MSPERKKSLRQEVFSVNGFNSLLLLVCAFFSSQHWAQESKYYDRVDNHGERLSKVENAVGYLSESNARLVNSYFLGKAYMAPDTLKPRYEHD